MLQVGVSSESARRRASFLSLGMGLANLGLLYNQQGRYSEAELLYQRSLAIKEKALGPEHPECGPDVGELCCPSTRDRSNGRRRKDG